MKLTRMTFDQPAFVRMVNNPRGGIARKINNVTDEIVDRIQENLGDQRGPGATRREPGPGVAPYRVTGRLQRSIHRISPVYDGGLIAAVVGTNVQNPQSGEHYGSTLLDKGYDFIPANLLPQ